MKQILVMMMAAVVLVGCGESKEGFKKGFDRQKKAAEAKAAAEKKAAKAVAKVEITDPIVKEAICKALKIPYGELAPPVELTNADLEKVAYIHLGSTQITDAGLKEVAKLKSLRYLGLFPNSHMTKAGVAELQKALPNCEIIF